MLSVSIEAVDLSAPWLLLRRFCESLPDNAGLGVRIGIVDTGIAMHHQALPNVSGGANLVLSEIQADLGAYGDWGPASGPGGDHGTHVAGIIGARPTDAINLRGVAPGAELRSYRVFPDTGGNASNYDILQAISRAIADGCHIINLSIGVATADEAIRAVIGEALRSGTLVIAAAGNDYRKPVTFPASVDSCIGVSAMGRTDAFPASSAESADVVRPFGTDPKDFFAAFSNYGPQIDFTAPGSGIVSTLPDDTYGVMSGTSMACPALVGFAAYLLAANPAIMEARGHDRIKRWKTALSQCGRPLGFGRDFEGFGSPSTNLVGDLQ